jgi:hypothetical protein
MKTHNTIIIHGALLLVSVLLVACSGGDTKVVTVPAADSTAPLVLITTPVNGATGVALNSALSATFSKAINPATLTSTTFSVSGVPGTVSVSGDNRSATFTPTTALAPATSYTATLTTGAQDTAGNGLGSNFSWSFTTGAAADTTAPVRLSVTPLVGSVLQQASITTISAIFNEPLNCTTVSTSNFILKEMGVTLTGYTECSNATITFRPLSGESLPTNTELVASITPAIKDLAGNAIGAYSWSFGMAPWTRQLGTAGNDRANAITSDAAGNVYVAGNTSDALDGQSSAGSYDLFITKYDANGVKQWTRQLGTAGDDRAQAITSDAVGNVYAAGYTSGALDGQTFAGSLDLFITKYDANGVKQWTRQLGTTGDDVAYAITSDASGNVYAAGSTYGALDGQTSSGSIDLFITKYDANGVKQWTRQLGTAGIDGAQAITSDASGNVYAAGYTYGALDGQSSAGGSDLFITKYDANGVKQWTRQLGTASDDVAYAITSDAVGNVYAAGNTYGALDGQASAGGSDLFITKYDTNGVKQWTRQLGTAYGDYAYAITSDAVGNVYAAGATNGALDGQSSAGNYDLFITKYDANGVKQWTRQLGTAGYDFAQAITSDAAGNVYAAGYTNGALDGQSSAGNNDFFIVKYQPDGRKR